MKDLLQKFINQTAEDAWDLYLKDECEYRESIEKFIDAVVEFFEKDRPEKKCWVVEFDEDYNNPVQAITDLLDDMKGYRLDDYFTAQMGDVNMWILLLDKGEKNG